MELGGNAPLIIHDDADLDVALDLTVPTKFANCGQVAEMAHAADISCESEIGFVGHSGGEGSAGTDPSEAAIFVRDSGVDAMAIAVGNVHLQTNHEGAWTKPGSARSRP